MAPARAAPALPPDMGVKKPLKDFWGSVLSYQDTHVATGWRKLPPPHVLGVWWVSKAAVWAHSRTRQDPLPCSNSTGGCGQSSLCTDTLGSSGLEKNDLQYLAFILNSPLEFMETQSCSNKPSISPSSPHILPVSVQPFMLHAQKNPTYKSEVKTLPKYKALQQHNCLIFLYLSLGAAKIPTLRPPNSRHTSQSSQREFPLSRRGRDLLSQCQQKSPPASSLWSFAHQSNKQQLKGVYFDMQDHTMLLPQKKNHM